MGADPQGAEGSLEAGDGVSSDPEVHIVCDGLDLFLCTLILVFISGLWVFPVRSLVDWWLAKTGRPGL